MLSFSEFRMEMGAALRANGAPAGLCDEVEDVGYEGEGAFDGVWEIYQDYEAGRGETSTDVIHDGILTMFDAYYDSWNYGPGRRVKKLLPAERASIAKQTAEYLQAKRPQEIF